MSALKIDDLHCQHQHQLQAVLSGVSLTVEENEILCLLGASGGGKTTLLRAIAGLMPVSRGALWLRGRQVEGGGISAFFGLAGDGLLQIFGGQDSVGNR